jgi:Myb-like DNA-binding domain
MISLHCFPIQDQASMSVHNRNHVKLCRMVEEHGEGSWSSIAKSFSGRIGKQCRERWHNQLRPDIRRDAWTDEEEALLAEAHARLGNKWADISKVLLAAACSGVLAHDLAHHSLHELSLHTLCASLNCRAFRGARRIL